MRSLKVLLLPDYLRRKNSPSIWRPHGLQFVDLNSSSLVGQPPSLHSHSSAIEMTMVSV